MGNQKEDSKSIPKAVIERLPRYYRYIGELKSANVERVSSQELSSIMKVTASQIRQDLNHFGGFGQQGYGYNVEMLHREIGKILGLEERHNLVIIGAGNLGQALANYMNFESRGFVVCGAFDINPELIGKKLRCVTIRPVSELRDFIMENQIDIAILSVNKEGAPRIAEILVKCGIKAILNFAHVDLNVPDGVIVENVHLSDSLMKLSYNIHKYEEGKNEKGH